MRTAVGDAVELMQARLRPGNTHGRACGSERERRHGGPPAGWTSGNSERYMPTPATVNEKGSLRHQAEGRRRVARFSTRRGKTAEGRATIRAAPDSATDPRTVP